MSSSGRVRLSAVWAMLDTCAKGNTRKKTDHYWRISYNGLTYPMFPVGDHGKSDPEIQVGHIKKMCRHLNILECAKKQIEQLR